MKLEFPLIFLSEIMKANYPIDDYTCLDFYHLFGHHNNFAKKLCSSPEFEYTGDISTIFKLLNIIFYG